MRQRGAGQAPGRAGVDARSRESTGARQTGRQHHLGARRVQGAQALGALPGLAGAVAGGLEHSRE